MLHVKIRDWNVGEALVRRSFSQNKVLKMEEEILANIKSELPDNTVIVNVDLRIELDVARNAGDPIPFDVEMVQYNINVKQHEASVDIPSKKRKRIDD